MVTICRSLGWCRFIFPALAVFVAVGCAQDSESKPDSALEDEMISMYQEYRAEAYPDAPEIRVREYDSIRTDTNTVLVDVREKKEYAVSIIPGAVTQKEFEKDKDRYKSHQIIVYCTIGYRSGEYTEKLADEGFSAYNLVGGVLAWAHEGHSFTGLDDGNETNRVHVYGKKWNLVPKGYEAVW